MPHTKESTSTLEMRECIAECSACHTICTETVQHCLSLGGEHASPEHIRTLLDCAQICETSADYLTRDSEFHTSTCAVCAEVCRACEKQCRSMARGDELIKKCADASASCAESCDRMAGASR